MTDLASTIRLRCPECLAVFRSEFAFCPADGATLVQCVEEPLIGASIAERYVLEELIGEGAMGLVYRASHVRLPRRFAIKILFGDLASDTRMRLRFAQEASAACRLNHPNVVTVVDFGKSDRGLLYLVMDYVEGETLGQLIKREAPLDEKRVIALARQLADGLAHAHAQGIVHRDFKPDNVVLEPQGDHTVPRILDFGLAISADDDVFDGRLTQHGWVVGTPAYLSPEQARDDEVDQRSDLYALGVVLYEMLAGVTPFDGAAMEVAHRNMLELPPPIRVRNPAAEVTPEVERVVRRLLEKDPADRFASAEELIEALDRINEALDYGIAVEADHLVLGEPIAEPFDPTAEVTLAGLRPRRGRVAAGLFAAAAVAGLVYLASSGSVPLDGGAEVAARVIEPETSGARLADRPAASIPHELAPAASPPAAPATAIAPAAPSEPVGEAAASGSPAAAPAADPPARLAKAAPARRNRGSAPGRALQRDAGSDDLAAAPEAGTADPDTPARLAAVSSAPAARRSSAEVPVPRLIEEYRQVGQAIARLQGTADPDVARRLRDRYFQIPYADALRIPALRRDTVAQLAALRRDLASVARAR